MSIAKDDAEHFRATHMYVCGAIAVLLGPKMKLLNTYPSADFWENEEGAVVGASGDWYRLSTLAEAAARSPAWRDSDTPTLRHPCGLATSGREGEGEKEGKREWERYYIFCSY